MAFLEGKDGLVECVALIVNRNMMYYYFRKPKVILEMSGASSSLVGTYLNESHKVGVRVGGRSLFVSVPGQRSYELVHQKGHKFGFRGMAGYTIEFIKGRDGAVTKVLIDHPNNAVTLTKRREP
jgi:hypothetical protein